MSWHVELLHRDGSVLSRLPVAAGANVVTIGRALDNDLVLDDPHCAPHHARLELSDSGSARLIDLGSRNGIANARGKRATEHVVTTDAPFRLGHASIRIRASDWPLAPELPLSRRNAWPIALLGFLLVLAHEAWDVWLTDSGTRTPKYVYAIAAAAMGISAWSAVYALLGRPISGAERFFPHLIIASTGYLTGMFLLWLLETLSFATSWLWPMRIYQPVIVLVAATTVRFHLRLADPRHWHTTRIVVALVAFLAITIPIAQQWFSHQRLTDVQTLHAIRHPALRIAGPVPIEKFAEQAKQLQAKVDRLRLKDNDAEGFDWTGMDSE